MGLSQSGLGDALFAGVQQRVLGTLFANPERSFYGNELLRLTASGKGALQRELDRLVKAGLVTVRSIGNQKHYQANPEAPIFEELRGIAVKTFGVGDVVREALRPLARKISAAFIYGSVAKRVDTTRSDIDLLVVSETLGYQDLIRALQPAERQIGRTISPTLYSAAELAKKRSGKGSFVTRILEQPKIFLIGSDSDLG
jgi:predicted nucleotidyltransferase